MVAVALEEERSLTAIMFDMNRFRDINKKHGHGAGDAVLRAVGRRLRKGTRSGDVVGRYGGDELLVLAVDAGRSEGYKLAHRLSRAIARKPASTGCGPISMSAGLGVAYLQPDDTLETLVARADDALLRAKSPLHRSARLRGTA